MAESIRTDTYRDLEGRNSEPWTRRILLLVIAAIPVLALLNVFGQSDEHSQASAPAAALSLSAPAKVRGGLLFQSKITVDAHRQLSQPKLVLSPGFLNGLTVNTIEPAASQELSRNGSLVLEYGVIPAGQRMNVWIQYQVNPTTVGRRTQRLELDDGDNPVVAITRSFRSLP
jgi:hypothetical protein